MTDPSGPRRLDPAALPLDPIPLFQDWMEDARALSGRANPDAMTLSTVGEDGAPEGRIVLLKGVDARGFVFYTNRTSRKGRDLAAHPAAALTFFWDSLDRQVRVVGPVEAVSDAESDAYYGSRARGSRIGAWASAQSTTIADRAELEARVKEAEARFGDGPVPRPPHWGGYRVAPRRIEFWQAGAFRLHDRFEYARDLTGTDPEWTVRRLSP